MRYGWSANNLGLWAGQGRLGSYSDQLIEKSWASSICSDDPAACRTQSLHGLLNHHPCRCASHRSAREHIRCVLSLYHRRCCVRKPSPPSIKGCSLIFLFTYRLYGVTVLQSLFYYQEFPKDRLILKMTVSTAPFVPTRPICLTLGTRLPSYGINNLCTSPRLSLTPLVRAFDTLAISLNSHALYFYLISNFTNISALQQEVW